MQLRQTFFTLLVKYSSLKFYCKNRDIVTDGCWIVCANYVGISKALRHNIKSKSETFFAFAVPIFSVGITMVSVELFNKL